MNSRIPYVLILTALAQLHAQQSATHLQLDTHPPKLDCNKLDFMKERKPIFGASPTGSHVGIAVSKTSFDAGEPVLVDVWIDNQTEHETFADRGCERPIDTPLYDESGRRQVGNQEREDQENAKKGITVLWSCSTSAALISVPPHTCTPPADAHLENLKLDYTLAPGVYYIYPGPDAARYKDGIKITIREKRQ